jgi:hypothetical protein
MAATATPLATPSAGYTLTLRTQLDSTPGTLGRLTSAIGKAGGDVGALDVVAKTSTVVVRGISIACRDEATARPSSRPPGECLVSLSSRSSTGPSPSTRAARLRSRPVSPSTAVTSCRWPTPRASAASPAPSLMKVEAARAIADVITEDGVTEDYVVPSVFDRRVVPAVAAAVRAAAG